MVEAPPLNDLADVNLSHYRGYADHKHGLHFTALPTVVFMSDKNMEDVIGLGSGEAIQLAKGTKPRCWNSADRVWRQSKKI